MYMFSDRQDNSTDYFHTWESSGDLVEEKFEGTTGNILVGKGNITYVTKKKKVC